MRWGVVRLFIVSTAFLMGLLISYPNSTANAPGSADLRGSDSSSLIVTCESGDPTVEHIQGIEGALQVKCMRSDMRVTRFAPPAGPQIQQPAKLRPTRPVAKNRQKPQDGGAALAAEWHADTTVSLD